MLEASPVTVLLVHERDEFRRGLRAVLDGHPEVTVVGEAGSFAAGVTEAERISPDVVVMVPRRRDTSVIEASRRIRGNDAIIKVLFLASHGNDDVLLSTILSGAAGYVLMDLGSSALQQAVSQVGHGGTLLDQQRARRFLDHACAAATSRRSGYPFLFSALEDLLLDMVGDGASDPDIARQLALTQDAIREHLLRLYALLVNPRRS